MSLFKRYYPVLVAVLVAVLPFGMNTYWTEVAVNVGLYALLALSLNVILGQAGIFHMGHAAFYAVGAYVTAILNTHYQIPILLLIPVAGAAAALFALVVARPIIHLRGDYLLIVTIGIVEIVRIALINDVFGLTGGANGIFGIARPEIFGIKIRKAIQFYYLIWIMVGLTVLLFHWLSESRFGRALNCIKEDDTAAEGCGMDVAHLKLMAFVIGAFWAGMAGNLFAAKMTIISPSSFTFWESVVVFAVVILSGGSQIGVLLGTFLIVALPEMFRDFASARMLVFGLAMMIMMVVRPQGLLPPSPRRYDVRRLLRRTRDFSSPVAPPDGPEGGRGMSLLSLQTVTKIFGGLTAVNEVSFDVEQGSIVGLIGPNGAGKTTVFNLITGNYVPDGGDIRFAGQSIKGMKPHTIVSLGIARTFQSIRLFPTLPLVENVLAGRHCRMHSGIIGSMFHTPAQRREERAALERAMNELEFVGLADSYAEEAGSLSYGNQRLLEIARALASDPKLIILDEPAGSMNDPETAVLIELIYAIRQRGVTVLLIEHDMGLVMKVCEKLLVLEYGSLIASGSPDVVRRDPKVIEAYLGQDD